LLGALSSSGVMPRLSASGGLAGGLAFGGLSGAGVADASGASGCCTNVSTADCGGFAGPGPAERSGTCNSTRIEETGSLWLRIESILE
jgi:hypothetical protein